MIAYRFKSPGPHEQAVYDRMRAAIAEDIRLRHRADLSGYYAEWNGQIEDARREDEKEKANAE